LVFQNIAHLSTALDVLERESEEYTKSLEVALDFKSQARMLTEIMIDEEILIDEFMKPYASLTDEEIHDLYLEEPRSEAYKNALSLGILRVEEDSYDAHVYSLNLVDPTMAPVVNKEGFVQVGDTLWQYTSNQIKICSPCNVSDKALLDDVTESDNEKGITVYTHDNSVVPARSGSNWDGNLALDWEPVGKKRRACYVRHGWSEISDNCMSCFMITKFYLDSRAQRHTWGRWRYRRSFKPYFAYDGTFPGYANYGSESLMGFPIVWHYQFVVPLGTTNTPMTNRIIRTNNSAGVRLHIHSQGQWPPPPLNYYPSGEPKYWAGSYHPYQITLNGRLVKGFNNTTQTFDLDDY